MPKIGMRERKLNTKDELCFLNDLGNYFENSVGSTIEKLQNFVKYVPRQDITNFITKYEIFKKIINVQGSIVECGIFLGGGLMTFAQLSSILEPINHQRKIIGFDTFSGFPKLNRHDKQSMSEHMHKGGLGMNSYADLHKCISLFDSNRFLSHIPKIEIIKGDASLTIPKYLKTNRHTVVSLLYLDFDIYKPTKTAIESFIPRMPKGSIIVFDEINNPLWKGETQAVLDTIGINNLKIQRFSYNSYMSYAILE